MEGGSSLIGRVEVVHSGQWGTICDDRWDINDANVVCRQLGLPPATQAFRRATHGQGSGQIWIDDIRCSGYELHVDECNHGGWGNHNCVHYEDASVECSSIISWSGEFFCNLWLELLTRMSLKDKEAEFSKFLEFFSALSMNSYGKACWRA